MESYPGWFGAVPAEHDTIHGLYDELSRRHVLTDTGIRDHRIHETGERADYRIESGRFGGTITQVAFGTTGADEWFRYISGTDRVPYRLRLSFFSCYPYRVLGESAALRVDI